MSVLVFAENAQGIFKKPVFEAATYAFDLAKAMGTDVHAISVGQVSDEELNKLGKYGVSKVYSVSNPQMSSFVNTAYAAAISSLAKEKGYNTLVLAQTYDGRAVAPRIAVKLKASAISGAISLADAGNGLAAQRLTYSSKGVESFKSNREKNVITIRTNSYKVVENPTAISIESYDFQPDAGNLDTVAKGIIKATEGISVTEAEIVISAGRGMKGPENWGIIEELAGLLGAATACSKPTSDMGWRPHHEHVGQTGIQIAPNLYVAIGISGAIQHLAGVSSSKNIVVINKDPEAPFFKIADYGIVGDLFEVVPRLIEAVKSVKATA
jgi:electron transfer flavoprotein alpha subunit